MSGPADAPVTVVYLHGGGYALGSAGVAAPITARLARSLRVVSVDYRLAPEHPYPAALDDAEDVFRAVRATSAGAADAGRNPTGVSPRPVPPGEAQDASRSPRASADGGPRASAGDVGMPARPTSLAHPTRVAIAGDSAGGALALGVAFRLALAGDARPDAIVVLCPHLDHQRSADIARPAAAIASAYLGATPPNAPMASPGLAPRRLARHPAPDPGANRHPRPPVAQRGPFREAGPGRGGTGDTRSLGRAVAYLAVSSAPARSGPGPRRGRGLHRSVPWKPPR